MMANMDYYLLPRLSGDDPYVSGSLMTFLIEVGIIKSMYLDLEY